MEEEIKAEHDQSEEIVCAICLSAVDSTKTMTATTPCNHTIHFSCAVQLAQKSTLECPTCRRSMPDLCLPRSVVPNLNADGVREVFLTNQYHNLTMLHYDNQLIQVRCNESTQLSCSWRQIPWTSSTFFLQDTTTRKFLSANPSSSYQSPLRFVEETVADENSLWRLEADGHLVNDSTQLCIEPGGGDDTVGRGLWLWSLDHDPWQLWNVNVIERATTNGVNSD